MTNYVITVYRTVQQRAYVELEGQYDFDITEIRKA